MPEARARFTPDGAAPSSTRSSPPMRTASTAAPVDLVLAVPSTARPSGAPLAAVAGLGDVVHGRLGARLAADLLCRGPGSLGHMRPGRDGFVVPPARRSAVRGRHLLVLDDTYVSGARAQSAAAALRLARAASVQIVAAGRVLRPERVPGHAAFLRGTAAAPAADTEVSRLSSLRSDRRRRASRTRSSALLSASRVRRPQQRPGPGATAGSDGVGRRDRTCARGRRTAPEWTAGEVAAQSTGSAPGGGRLPERGAHGRRPSVRRTRLSLRAVPLLVRLLWVQPGCAATAMVARPVGRQAPAQLLGEEEVGQLRGAVGHPGVAG